MLIADGWKDYALIDTGDGEKLERWGGLRVIRPDPQIIWPRQGNANLWQEYHLRYRRGATGGGGWDKPAEGIPEHGWNISYGDLRFRIRPTDFKHMGLFPEQAVNWRWAGDLIRLASTPDAARPIKVLNLFGYTGGATAACLQAGADVTHVDAARGMNNWAKDNIALSGLTEKKHRVLTDDVLKFVKREARRQSFYDAIIMDPPVYGRGPSGELWKLEEKLFELVMACAYILTDKPLFMLINAYTAGFSPAVAENILRIAMARRGREGRVTGGEIGLRAETGGVTLPCGLYGRWEAR
jgi:23S rRNA (cytosine1962-C5)-methyltransferase